MNRKIALTGLLFITLSIVLGAFGAHALKEMVEPDRVASFETGIRYQMYVGLSYLSIAFMKQVQLKWFYRLTFSGVLFFSISIYLLALQDVFGLSLRFLGPITPIGGVLMIAGYIELLIRIFRDRSSF